MLHEYDIISLSETKTCLPVKLPGYVTYKGKSIGSDDRGGVVVLVKNYLSNFVCDIDVGIADQVWLQFSNVEGVLFGFCYVPPSDSQYYSHDAFAAVHEKLRMNHMSNGYVIMGDMNARFGKAVRELATLYELPGFQCSYPDLQDNIPNMNDNAEFVSTLCLDHKLVVLNNLKTSSKHFHGGLTYRKRDTWVSELDTCLVTSRLIDYVRNFEVVKTVNFPSDHAPISISLDVPGTHLDSILDRAEMLADHAVLHGSAARTCLTKNSIKYSRIDKEKFVDNLSILCVPALSDDVDIVASRISDSLYTCAESSKVIVSPTEARSCGGARLGRWERILEDADDVRVWKAISWKGDLEAYESDSVDRPSDDDFKVHFERVLNPDPAPPAPLVTAGVSIPVLDDPILPVEVDNQIKKMKVDKACGPDGVSPGLLTILPPVWLLALTTMFNTVFMSGVYPASWVRAKVVTIFKKGNRLDPNNYRGISIINSIAKLYDMILSHRLGQWFRPCREQAGAQSHRGCIEQIVSLRLLTDMARRKKLKLFVTFVDFSKAYDMVPRHKLFSILGRLGCGMVMLAALVAIYSVTESVIGGAVITSTLGVRQGSPTSCLLFIIFMDELIKLVKQRCCPDGFLGWLHLLVLMDDTVLLATSREGMINKIRLLQAFCSEHGMVINESKTKFFVISGTKGDEEPIRVNGLTISHCSVYVYLGSPFTSDGSVSSALKAHAKAKLSHVIKFVSFVKKNNDVPYIVKRRVFDAALMSALLYGCESWLGADLKPVIKLYNWTIKQLLGVRKSTPNDICYAEAGYPSLQDLVKYRQHKFFKKMENERHGLTDDPLMYTIDVVMHANTTMGALIRNFLATEIPDMQHLLQNVYNRISASMGSRCVVYRSINPTYEVHSLYRDRHTVNDRLRISFTRFRVSGHNLAIESGRWNRRGRGRLPVEERLCTCGAVQTERHVVEECFITQDVRQIYGLGVFEELFNGKYNNEDSCKITHRILNLYM